MVLVVKTCTKEILKTEENTMKSLAGVNIIESRKIVKGRFALKL